VTRFTWASFVSRSEISEKKLITDQHEARSRSRKQLRTAESRAGSNPIKKWCIAKSEIRYTSPLSGIHGTDCTLLLCSCVRTHTMRMFRNSHT
jgi:hypothetical protein